VARSPDPRTCSKPTQPTSWWTGRLPLLTRFGYKGPIYATPATIALAELILKDSAYLQNEDANRRRFEAGKPPIEPLYTQKEVDKLHGLYRTLRYDHPTEVAPGIKVRAVEAGHTSDRPASNSRSRRTAGRRSWCSRATSARAARGSIATRCRSSARTWCSWSRPTATRSTRRWPKPPLPRATS
jgi:hypothetical protein